MRLARAMRIYTILEQPAHNTTGGMENLSRFRDMITVNPVQSPVDRVCCKMVADFCDGTSMFTAKVYKFRVQMASFGACTNKPSYLYSQHACFKDGLMSRATLQGHYIHIVHIWTHIYSRNSHMKQELADLSESRAATIQPGWKKVRKDIVKRGTNDVRWQSV